VKITFISNLFPDNYELYRGQDNANLLHAFSPDIHFRVISPRPRLNFYLKRKVACRDVDASLSPLYLQYLYVPKFGSFFNHYLYYYSLKQAFVRNIMVYRPDMILVSWTYPDAVAVIQLAKEYGLPVVVITQGSDVHIYLNMPYRSRVIVNSLFNANAVITRSRKLAAIIKSKSSCIKYVTPIYNGVDQCVFRFREKRELLGNLSLQCSDKHLLYVGNFYKVKNPQLIIRALREVKNRCPDLSIKLLMIGEGYLQGKIENLTKDLSLTNNVTFLGRKTSHEIASYMQASDLLCIPSFNEGLPNVLLEALSCGLPVVSTDVGGISEVLCDTRYGSLVETFDPVDYANRIIQRLNLTVDRGAIIDYANRFSWENTVQSYTKIFKNAISGK